MALIVSLLKPDPTGVGYFFPGDAYRVVVDESLGIFKDADGALFARFEVEYAF